MKSERWFLLPRLVLGLAIAMTLLFTIPRSAVPIQNQQQQQRPHISGEIFPSSIKFRNNSNSTTNQNSSSLSICFVTSIYAKWVSHADRLQNVTTYSDNNDDFHFFAYTNLPNLNAERLGWYKILKTHPTFNRYITQSRWPKFFAWQEDPLLVQQKQQMCNSSKSNNNINNNNNNNNNNNTSTDTKSYSTTSSSCRRDGCQVIFYLDSIGTLIGSPDDFRQMAREIYTSEVGLAQYPHKGGGGAFGEFRRIEVFHKDLPGNIQASKTWLLQQPDFRPYNCTLYENRYFGYRVDSTYFQNAATFLWDHYSLEQDSWRDQPLWCYTLDHFNITPIPLRHQELFKLSTWRMGKAKHRYDELAEGDAKRQSDGKEVRKARQKKKQKQNVTL